MPVEAIVARSSREAELNSAIKVEGIGVMDASRELLAEDRRRVIRCGRKCMQRRMLRRTMVVESETHLGTKQPLGPRTIRSYGTEVQEVPRAGDASDIMARAAEESELRDGLQHMGCHTLQECSEDPKAVLGKPVRRWGLAGGACGLLGKEAVRRAVTANCGWFKSS